MNQKIIIMKLKHKILTLIAGTLTTFVLTSCNDFLDRDPLGQFTEDDAPNALIGGKMYNVYYLIRSYNITAGIPAFMIHMVRSEDSEKGSDAGDGADQAAMWDDFQYTASNGTLSAYWGQNYKIIYQCNEILDDLENSGNKDDLENVRTKGEALFFRAYCYFNLVRAWGEVPLVTFKVKEASDANRPKSDVNEIYEQIDKDLTEAEKCLPLTWTSEYTGRITWGAARSLHARTYMMRNDWDNMYDASTEVIKSGLYNLNTPVDKVFTVEGENCGESVFELQCESTDALKNSDVIGSQFCQVQGVRGAGDWDLGWGWHMGTVLLGGAFEPGDPRKDATLLYFRRSISDPVTPENTNKPYGESPVSTAMGAYFTKRRIPNPNCVRNIPKTVLGKHPHYPLPGRIADGCRSRQRERYSGRGYRLSGAGPRPCTRCGQQYTAQNSRPLTKAHCAMPFATNAALSWHWNPTVSTTSCAGALPKRCFKLPERTIRTRMPCCHCRKKKLTNRTGC